MRQTERAIFDLRSGHPVLLRSGNQAALVQAVEGLDARALARFRSYSPGARVNVVLTRHRLAAILPRLSVQSELVCLEVPGAQTLDALRNVVLAPESSGLDELVRAQLAEPSSAERAAVALARRGRLLPAMVSLVVQDRDAEAVEALVADGTLLALDAGKAEAMAAPGNAGIERVSEANVPLLGSEETRFVLYRESGADREHLALLIGEPDQWPQPVPVRLHSACLTGDLFGSLRCDCGEQLRSGVEAIAASGGGILLYLAQEGRDIGLANKLRAYSLQDTGLDTVDADQVLGFSEDERQYHVAVAMLRDLGVGRVALLTNNPTKINAIRRGGIDVVSRQALHGQVNAHNRRYLSAKANRSGHLMGTLLDQSQEGL